MLQGGEAGGSVPEPGKVPPRLRCCGGGRALVTPAQPCQQQPEEEKPQTQELFWGRKRALTLPQRANTQPAAPSGAQTAPEASKPRRGLQGKGGQSRCSLPRLHPGTGAGPQPPTGTAGPQPGSLPARGPSAGGPGAPAAPAAGSRAQGPRTGAAGGQQGAPGGSIRLTGVVGPVAAGSSCSSGSSSGSSSSGGSRSSSSRSRGAVGAAAGAAAVGAAGAAGAAAAGAGEQ